MKQYKLATGGNAPELEHEMNRQAEAGWSLESGSVAAMSVSDSQKPLLIAVMAKEATANADS